MGAVQKGNLLIMQNALSCEKIWQITWQSYSKFVSNYTMSCAVEFNDLCKKMRKFIIDYICLMSDFARPCILQKRARVGYNPTNIT